GTHYLISKSGAEQVTTGVVSLAMSERGEEIARMLAGAQITDEARAAARRLIDESAG
ncbi:MAG: DNA repair protein RecN, partial [Mesorhizobium sp.]